MEPARHFSPWPPSDLSGRLLSWELLPLLLGLWPALGRRCPGQATRGSSMLSERLSELGAARQPSIFPTMPERLLWALEGQGQEHSGMQLEIQAGLRRTFL